MKRAKASEELVLDIRRTILSGKYPPGSQLPSERELAKKYNLSRVPVREAIEQLVNEKILRTEPHVGLVRCKIIIKEYVSDLPYREKDIKRVFIYTAADRKRGSRSGRREGHRRRCQADPGTPFYLYR